MDYPFEALPDDLRALVHAAADGDPPGALGAPLGPSRQNVRVAALALLGAAAILARLALAPGGFGVPALRVPLGPRPAAVWALVAGLALGLVALRLGPVLRARRSRLPSLALGTRDLLLVVRGDGLPVTLERWRNLKTAFVASAWIELHFARETLRLPIVDRARAAGLVGLARDTRARLDAEPGTGAPPDDALARLESAGTPPHPGPRARHPERLAAVGLALLGASLAAGAWALGVRLLESERFEAAVAGKDAAAASTYRTWASRAKVALAEAARLAPLSEHEAAAAVLEDDRFFEAARGRSEALGEYLGRFRHGRHVDEARVLEDDAAFAEARADPGTLGLGSYVSFHRHGRHADEADDAFFEHATTRKDLERYRTVLPRGRHISDVEERLK